MELSVETAVAKVVVVRSRSVVAVAEEPVERIVAVVG